MMRRLGMIVAASTLALAWLPATASAGGGGHGCAEPTSDATGTHASIEGSCFTPTVLRVDAGSTVTWVNRDRGIPHTVTGANQSWGSTEELGFDDRATYRFDERGVYPYFCLYHPGMTGAVVVGDGSGQGVADATGAVAQVQASPPAADAAATDGAASASQPNETSSLVGLGWGIGGLAAGLALGALVGRGLRRRAVTA
jgi:plastocyanin